MVDWSQLSKKTTPCVNTILKTWHKIQLEQRKYPRYIALQRVVRLKDVRNDQQYAKEFYKRYKNKPYVFWHKDYFDFFGSIHIYDEITNISFAYPFQCRQWPHNDLYKKIAKFIIQNYSTADVVGLKNFLKIWNLLRIKESIKLSKKDIKILKSILYSSHDDSLIIINNNEVARQTGIPQTTVNDRLLRLERTNVFTASFVTNAARINFLTFLTTQIHSKLIDQILATIQFDEYTLYIYQVPNSWFTGDERLILNSLEMGYNPSLLGTKIPKKISKERQFDEIEPNNRHLSTNQNHVRTIDISCKNNLKNRDEINILLKFMPAYRKLYNTPKDIAEQFSISETKATNILLKLLGIKAIFPTYSLNFLGFHNYVILFVIASNEVLQRLKIYIRQFFYHRCYCNKNLAVLHLRISPYEYRKLKKSLESNKHLFEVLIYKKIVFDEQNYLRMAIKPPQYKFQFDDFFGLLWQKPDKNINLSDNYILNVD